MLGPVRATERGPGLLRLGGLGMAGPRRRFRPRDEACQTGITSFGPVRTGVISGAMIENRTLHRNRRCEEQSDEAVQLCGA
jgi:hypothetical protein